MKIIFKLGDIMREMYHTKQKEVLLEKILEEDKEFTVMDLYEKLDHKIGLTTIYRFLDKLILDGTIQKIPGKGNTTYYQYLEECEKENHFYLKCSCCGEVIHVDCDCVKDLSFHMEKEHGFQLEKNHIMMGGICEKCLEGLK